MKPMRVVVSAVFVAALSAGGVAAAQVPGQPVVSHASYTIEPYAPPGAPITIQGTGVRLRAEPFTTPQTQVLSSGGTGLVLNVVGIARLPDWNWYQVVLKNGQKAFIRSDLTSSPSRGNGQAAPVAPAPVVIAPVPATPLPTPVAAAPAVIAPPVSTYTPTPPPEPQPYVPPSYSQPIPIAPQPVPLAPAATPAPTTGGLPSLDLPKPTDPAGLRSN
ncbi:MAG: hypothetical protein EON61_02125 [Alphaproteobacteria bacterium]|nr:MAG: hypothetical protein EON61_02125 [Alphaproteobacteria bacterium]